MALKLVVKIDLIVVSTLCHPIPLSLNQEVASPDPGNDSWYQKITMGIIPEIKRTGRLLVEE